jgi:S-adenosylmethionine uptake transporter
MCFYKGLKGVEVADAAALENLQYIILAIVGMTFFNEKCTKTKVASIIIGFLGAVIIVKPDLFELNNTKPAVFNESYIYTILAIIFWSLNTITVKILGRTEKNRTQLFYLLIFAISWSLPGAVLKFEPIDIGGFKLPIIPVGIIDTSFLSLGISNLKYIAIMALFYFIHSLAYFNALKRDISLVVPFRYTKLIFSGIAGYYVFNEVPSQMQYVGYMLIILSGLALIRKEVKNYKKSKQSINAQII